MKDTHNVCIVGERVVLVPYRPEHVPTYHKWMQDSYIQEMTASEDMTLDDVHDMQRTWHDDPTKCVFIILDKSIPEENATNEQSTQKYAMAGDVDLFLSEDEGDGVKVGEVNIMTAEERSRRKGLGKEAMLLMMNYGVTTQGVGKFVAKISEENAPSIALFTSLGFAEVNRSSVWKEVTMELAVDAATSKRLADAAAHAMQVAYDL